MQFAPHVPFGPPNLPRRHSSPVVLVSLGLTSTVLAMRNHPYRQTHHRSLNFRFGLLALAFLTALVNSGCDHSGTSATLPTLTTIAEIRNLSQEEADRGYPVKFHGVATFYDSATRTLVVQDSSAGILVNFSKV